MKKWKVWVQYETEIKADNYNDALNMGVNEWELNYGQVIEENKNSIKNLLKMVIIYAIIYKIKTRETK